MRHQPTSSTPKPHTHRTILLILLIPTILAIGFIGSTIMARSNPVAIPALSASARPSSAGIQSSASTVAISPHSAPLDVTERPSRANTLPPLVATMQWHTECPQGAGWCASFPYVGRDSFYHDTNLEAGTARNRRASGYGSATYRSGDGRFCLNGSDDRCQDAKSTESRYYVETIVTKYTDPCQALLALNGGDVQHAKCQKEHGYPTIHFTDAHGSPRQAVWRAGKVYYLETHTLNGTHAADGARFLASFHFVN